MASLLSDDTLSSDPTFAGLFLVLNLEDESEQPSATEIVDDYKAEQETLDLHGDTDSSAHLEGDGDEDDDARNDEDMDKASGGFSQLQETVKNASKGVTEGADGEYWRFAYFLMYLCSIFNPSPASQMAKCTEFLVAKKLIKKGKAFFSVTPHANSPLFIMAWIMDR